MGETPSVDADSCGFLILLERLIPASSSSLLKESDSSSEIFEIKSSWNCSTASGSMAASSAFSFTP